MLTAVPFDEQVLMDGSGHPANGEVGVRPELGASACKPSTRYARIPPAPLLKKGGSYVCPLLKKGGKLPTRNSKEAKGIMYRFAIREQNHPKVRACVRFHLDPPTDATVPLYDLILG